MTGVELTQEERADLVRMWPEPDSLPRRTLTRAEAAEADEKHWRHEAARLQAELDNATARIDGMQESVAKFRRERNVLRNEVARLTRERDEAQEHVAYHLRDFVPLGDMKATGDLAVDMVRYVDRLKADNARLAAVVDAVEKVANRALERRNFMRPADVLAVLASASSEDGAHDE